MKKYTLKSDNNLNQKLKFIQDNIKRTTKDLEKEREIKLEREQDLAKVNAKLKNLQKQEEEIGEITPLPFNNDEWDTIEESYKLYESTLNKQRDLTSKLNAAKANHSKELSEKNNLTIKINEETSRFNKALNEYYTSCGENPKDNENLEIKLLDDEIAENFIEKIFNNMKVIRGLITKD